MIEYPTPTRAEVGPILKHLRGWHIRLYGLLWTLQTSPAASSSMAVLELLSGVLGAQDCHHFAHMCLLVPGYTASSSHADPTYLAEFQLGLQSVVATHTASALSDSEGMTHSGGRHLGCGEAARRCAHAVGRERCWSIPGEGSWSAASSGHPHRRVVQVRKCSQCYSLESMLEQEDIDRVLCIHLRCLNVWEHAQSHTLRLRVGRLHEPSCRAHAGKRSTGRSCCHS